MRDPSSGDSAVSSPTRYPVHEPRGNLQQRNVQPPVRRHPAILRLSTIAVSAILAMLMVTAVVPPIVADQSDRAVVNAPVTLLTAPIGGEIAALSAAPGSDVHSGDTLAQISNPRVDRAVLISLQERSANAREKLAATQAKKQSDRAYVAALDGEIASQTAQLKAQFQSRIEELRARVAQSAAMSSEKKALVDRQNSMVARNAASLDMVKPTSQQYSAALHNTEAENAKLNQKVAQLDALKQGIYVGEDLVAINDLAQKRRDIDLDARRMDIEETELSAVIADLQGLIDAERQRLDRLAGADVRSPGEGKVLTVGAATGRHVNAGDTIASVVDCDKRFVVAIFSYRQGQSMQVGSRVRIDGGSFRSGIVNAVLPKTSDKVDERFAVPFPQTERRELYAIIAPDQTGGPIQPAAASAQVPACTVGQWVTVTRDNGIVPSMSVIWRRLENLTASWGDGKAEAAPSSDAATRRAGIARLEAALRSPPRRQQVDGDEDWLMRTQSVVSR